MVPVGLLRTGTHLQDVLGSVLFAILIGLGIVLLNLFHAVTVQGQTIRRPGEFAFTRRSLAFTEIHQVSQTVMTFALTSTSEERIVLSRFFSTHNQFERIVALVRPDALTADSLTC
ncbi:MAG: hypothetical protein JXB85_06915 [Anaerolineales bacterium]|nr:hypothetical protein [Anaerolineales bacterium]